MGITGTPSDANLWVSLVPGLLAGLYGRRRKIDAVAAFVDESLETSDEPELVAWLGAVRRDLAAVRGPPAAVEEWGMDPSRAVMLAYQFGDLFLEAVEMVGASGVEFEENRRFAAVRQQKPAKGGRRRDRTALVYLQARKLLQELGLKSSPTGHLVEAADDADYAGQLRAATDEFHAHGMLGTSFAVDLGAWYCSCDGYQRCYTTSWITGEAVDCRMRPVSELGDSALLARARAVASEHGVRQLDPMPICSHLLAALIEDSRLETVSSSSESSPVEPASGPVSGLAREGS